MRGSHSFSPRALFRPVGLILAAVFLVMLVFNWLTPLISDDYSYLLKFPTHEPVETFWDIVVSQYYHYMQWGGRTIAIGLNQIFLWLGKWVFNLANAAVFTFTVWLCAKLAAGQKSIHPAFLLVVLGLFFHFNPAFGAVNLWMCGSCVYLWPLMLGLVFLLPYRLQLDRDLSRSKGAAVGMFFAGIAAGWGNENTSGAVLLACLVLCVLSRLLLGRASLWQLTGATGCLAGFLLLMCAPGQWVRVDRFGEDSISIFALLLSRAMNATHTLRLYGMTLALLFAAAYAVLLLCRPSLRAALFPIFWFVLGLAANYALILSPIYYVRSFYPVLAFWVIATGSALTGLVQHLPTFGKFPQGVFAGVLCVLLCFDLVEGGYDILNYSIMRQVREDTILTQVAEGEKDIETYAIYPYTRFCGAYGQPDLRLDKDNWVNVNMALHLGADSLVVTEQHYYPFPGYDDFSNTVETELSYALE